ncbi:aldose 1-epimerase [Nocardia sp. NBC_00565]|uniref:aldose epimerase family protein n=1 Tax=Nocardia sp. NBC_00565 TaxID=2975993 RepID=UPI002E82356F|nr:aldose 1-epimerase [Nocardia sp. NBC_00565]WUC06056.1 aldose 1-epimerase [Nocardia sp. NBC_00565]
MADQGNSTVSLTAGKAELTVDPQNGGRLTSLRISDLELLRQGPRYGAFPMVPWCGRMELGQFRNGGAVHQMPINAEPHAIHGTGRDAAWRVVSVDESSATLTVDLAEPWPYPGRVTQLIELTEDSLTLTMRVETTGQPFPAQVGWHPWFRRNLDSGNEIQLDFTPAWQEERGDNYLPTGRHITPEPGPWDDCFGMPDGTTVTLTWPHALELKITSPAQWVVVFDEKPEAACVEPQSGPPNGLNTHPRPVTAGDPLELSTTWSWRLLD